MLTRNRGSDWTQTFLNESVTGGKSRRPVLTSRGSGWSRNPRGSAAHVLRAAWSRRGAEGGSWCSTALFIHSFCFPGNFRSVDSVLRVVAMVTHKTQENAQSVINFMSRWGKKIQFVQELNKPRKHTFTANCAPKTKAGAHRQQAKAGEISDLFFPF